MQLNKYSPYWKIIQSCNNGENYCARLCNSCNMQVIHVPIPLHPTGNACKKLKSWKLWTSRSHDIYIDRSVWNVGWK